MYSGIAKRGLDVLSAILVLILLSPVLATLAFLIRWRLGSPILFSQIRPGVGGRPFTIYKFRTMTDARDREKSLLPDSERLSRFGRFLRSSSLDELPEFINVVRGDMSLVGPRPLLIRYLDRYTPEQMRRHEVKPGITGWAQVNGRNAITWKEKFKLDEWYVDNYSFWLDLKILIMTAAKVLTRSGINQSEETTMEEFVGSNDNEAN